MAHKWLIKAWFTAYKVHQYFTPVCSGRFMYELCLLVKDYSPPSKKKTALKITIEKWPFDLIPLCGIKSETPKKYKPPLLLVINVTGNAYSMATREAQGEWYGEDSLGGSDKLAETLRWNKVSVNLRMRLVVRPSSVGTQSFGKTVEVPSMPCYKPQSQGGPVKELGDAVNEFSEMLQLSFPASRYLLGLMHLWPVCLQFTYPLHPISLFIIHCTALSRFVYFIMFSAVSSLISFLIFLLNLVVGRQVATLSPPVRDKGLPLCTDCWLLTHHQRGTVLRCPAWTRGRKPGLVSWQ